MGIAQKFQALARWMLLSSGWQRHFALLAAGLVSALAMPPIDFFAILFITLPLLVLAMDAAVSDAGGGLLARSRGPFLAGWWFALGYFTGSLWWIGNALLVEAEIFAWALPLAVVGLPAALACFWGVALAAIRPVWSSGPERVILMALALAVAEYLRGTLFTGFPWNLPGQAAMVHPIAMQSAALVGLHGMNLLALFAFCLPAVWLSPDRRARRTTNLLSIAAAVLIGLHLGHGAWRLAAHPVTDDENAARLRIVQPAIPQEWKIAADRPEETVAIMLDLSTGEPGARRPDFVIWPESAFPFLLTERREVLSAIAEMLPDGTRLVTGALRAEAGAGGDPYGFVYNSVYVIGSDGEIEQAADKVHLVPFGEYLPFQDLLERAGLAQLTRVHGGFDAGAERGLFDMGRFGMAVPLICYEIIFPGQILDRDGENTGAGRPSWLINLTNDAWFGRTPGPYQHLRQAVLRGVEEGLPVVRAANNGVSSVSDPLGRPIAMMGLGERGSFDASLPARIDPPFFARHGNQVFGGLLAFMALTWLMLRLMARRHG